MWLTNSSLGRKVVMSVTGLCLILFLTFHVLMNAVALFSMEGYNMVCEFLGANWYALVATVGLAALAVIHILFAFWLTFQNRKARGNDRYAVTSTPKSVEWASQNMLALGIVIVAFLGLHLYDFWANMQLAELVGDAQAKALAANGEHHIHRVFACPVSLALYLIAFVALWFHMTHGFWSALQTIGTNGKKWMCRLKAISCAWATVVCLLFAVEAVTFFVQAQNQPCCKACTECTEGCCQDKATCDKPCCQGNATCDSCANCCKDNATCDSCAACCNK